MIHWSETISMFGLIIKNLQALTMEFSLSVSSSLPRIVLLDMFAKETLEESMHISLLCCFLHLSINNDKYRNQLSWAILPGGDGRRWCPPGAFFTPSSSATNANSFYF